MNLEGRVVVHLLDQILEQVERPSRKTARAAETINMPFTAAEGMSEEWVREGLVSAMSVMGAWTAKRAISARDWTAEERPGSEISKSVHVSATHPRPRQLRWLQRENSGWGGGSQKKKPWRGWFPGLFKMKAQTTSNTAAVGQI